MRLGGLLGLAAVAAFLLPGGTSAQATRLEATVGPGFTISLKLPGGEDVRQLDPGTYEIVVRDLSDFHNFHLTGPSVNESTTVEFQGTVTWTVTFPEGRFRFQCDPHRNDLNGAFVVGNPPPVTTPPPPPSPKPAVKKLTATVGPGSTITLRSASGAKLHGLKAGAYAITVRDRTSKHNFHLTGAGGVNRKTGIAQIVTVTWKVTLKKGTLRFFSDAAAGKLRGNVTVSG